LYERSAESAPGSNAQTAGASVFWLPSASIEHIDQALSPALHYEVPHASLERAGGRRGRLSRRSGRWFALPDSDRGGAGGLEFLEPGFEVFFGLEVVEDFGGAVPLFDVDVEVWEVGWDYPT
jgi:hypothetical protein